MKYTFLVFILIFFTVSYTQNITVDSQSLSPQELIEDVLIDSDCIENVIVTNAVSGNFGGAEFSYGTFDATGTTFPFERGIVLSTGRLSNVPGPNDSLSDDDALDWNGDADLEFVLQEAGTENATIIEFNFTAITNQISFRYLFASEEYRENNPFTCDFSDVFGFLIRKTDSDDFYENIALVPGTTTPVKVTTVTPGVPGSCPPLNEAFFDQFNEINPVISPTNFNGQTTVLTATADLIAGEEYSIKLVIADETNPRFDSAVFLEAGSFVLTRDLGEDRLLANTNPICGTDTLLLDATITGNNGYNWYRDGALVQTDPIGCVNCGTFEVDQEGTYNVEVLLDNSCIAYGEIVIEYSQNPVANDAIIIECDLDQNGTTIFNLFQSEEIATNNNNTLFITDFFLNASDALSNDNPIEAPTVFENTTANQVVYARVENNFGCYDVSQIELQISSSTLDIPIIYACDFGEIDGFTIFDLSQVATAIENQIPIDATLSFYKTESDAFEEVNSLANTYENIEVNSETILVKVESSSNCFAISEVNLEVLFTPEVSENETVIYCTNTFPETTRLFGGVLNDLPNNYLYEWQLNGNSLPASTSFIDVNETGTYTVIITDPNGCSNTREISVIPSEIGNIESIEVTGTDNTNTIVINVSGNGDYEFSLDYENGFYQSEHVFNNISPGFHTIYVRDKNGCGITSQIFSILGFPKFFTPNGDGQNDFWKLDGVNFDLYPGLIVSIYNRYGKLITTQDANSSGWDGSYNGSQLPNTDYWFTANFGNGRTFTGHFALKR